MFFNKVVLCSLIVVGLTTSEQKLQEYYLFCWFWVFIVKFITKKTYLSTVCFTGIGKNGVADKDEADMAELQAWAS